MTKDPKAHVVRLSDDLIAKCKDWATKVAAHYGSGDALQAMPWTRGLMSKEELQQWVASRKEAGRAIDIGTCELGCWKAYDADPYGADPDLPEEMQQVGTNRFVRSPESRGWVCEDDLPLASVKAMYERIHREADTYENYLKRPKDTPELWQAKHDPWQVVGNFACFIEWKDEDRATAVRELQELGEHLRRWQELHPDQVDHRKGDPAIKSVCHLVQSIMDTVVAQT